MPPAKPSGEDPSSPFRLPVAPGLSGLEPPSCRPSTRLRPNVPVLFRSPSRHPRGQDFNVSLAGTQSAHHGGRSERPTLACWLAHLRDARPVTDPPPPLLLLQLLRLLGQAGVGPRRCGAPLSPPPEGARTRQPENERGRAPVHPRGLRLPPAGASTFLFTFPSCPSPGICLALPSPAPRGPAPALLF